MGRNVFRSVYELDMSWLIGTCLNKETASGPFGTILFFLQITLNEFCASEVRTSWFAKIVDEAKISLGIWTWRCLYRAK